MSLKVTQKQALGFLFDRQFLNTPTADPIAITQRLIVIQTQYSASLPGALWARSKGLRADDVQHALTEARNLVKFWAVRGTLHTVATADLPFITQAVNLSRVEGYLGYMQERMGWEVERVTAMNEAIYAVLKDGPLRRQDIHAAVPDAQVPGAGWGMDVKPLVYAGRVVIAGDKQFAQRERWLSHLDWQLPHADEASARVELLRRYLSGYGVATLQDFAHWSGFGVVVCREIFQQAQDHLLALEVEGWNGTFYVLKEDEDALLASRKIPAISLLPKFDVVTLAYKDKTRFMGKEHYKRVYRIAAQVEATLMLKGRIVATWRQKLSANKLTLTLEAFRPFTPAEMQGIEKKAYSLAEFYGLSSADITVI